jgi:predicted dehydrogenase
MEQYGVLIVGAGHIGRSHVEAWNGDPQTRVVAVVDTLPGRAETVAGELGVPEHGTDHRRYLERDDVQIVAVCTPPYAHCGPTLDALAAGKHVACEKPFSLSVEEAERMTAAAEAAQRFLVVCSARARYTAAALKAREMVEAGRLGNVYHARSSQFRQRGRPGVDILRDATWFISKGRAGGGALIDIGVYEIDLMLWLMGNPKVLSVSASIYQGIGDPRGDVTQDVEDHATLYCQLEGGKSFSLEIAWSSHIAGQNVRFVLGDQGGLRFAPLTLLSPPPPDSRSCAEEQLVENDQAGGGLPGMVRGLVAAIEGGPEPMTPARDALVVTKVIDAGYRSAASGRPVTL